jgi:hypothetical protein
MKKFLIIIIISIFISIKNLSACDLCSHSIYVPNPSEDLAHRFRFSLSEQFTSFGTLQRDGQEVSNTRDQYLNSSITQLALGYTLTKYLSLQLNLPFIYREYQRPQHALQEKDEVSGIGDATLVLGVAAPVVNEKDFQFSLNFVGGIKFPTGRTNRLEEELRSHHHSDPNFDSAIHGHDLALGSGSFDTLVGTGLELNWTRYFLNADFVYTIRTEGDFNYHYANDMTWKGGPGVYVYQEHDFTFAIQANVSGESKGRDTFRGVQEEDTGITTVYLGPKMLVSWNNQLSADLGVELPVSIDNTSFQAVPDYRIRAGVSWRF